VIIIMREAIEKITNYIEDNYHESINSYVIEDITGEKYSKISKEFKIMCNITLEQYVKQRRLTKIIEQIIDSKNTIIKNNILPYSSQSCFNEVFTDEYKVSPLKLIKNKDRSILCKKIDVEELVRENVRNKEMLKELIVNNNDSRRDALNYILSLNPYSITILDELFSHQLGLGYKLINRRYDDENGYGFIKNDVGVNRYLDEVNIVRDYYNFDSFIEFPQGNVGFLGQRKYYAIKPQFIMWLDNNNNLKNILEIKRLETIFVHLRHCNRLAAIEEVDNILGEMYYYVGRKKYALDEVAVVVLKKIFLQDIGLCMYNTLEELCDEVRKEFIINEGEIEKKIIKLLRSSLLCIKMYYKFDNIKSTFGRNKEVLKEIRLQEKNFLKLLIRIKKYITEVKVIGETTYVKYSSTAVKYHESGKYDPYNYSFAYENDSGCGMHNIFIGSTRNDDYLELEFHLVDTLQDALTKDERVMFKNKVMQVIKLINNDRGEFNNEI